MKVPDNSLYSSATCDFCGNKPPKQDIEVVNICSNCADCHPRLISGIQAETLVHVAGATEEITVPFSWCQLFGLPTETQLIGKKNSNSSLGYLKTRAESLIQQLGVRRTLTYLSGAHAVSELYSRDEFTQSEAAIPPKMLHYAIGLAGSVPSQSRQENEYDSGPSVNEIYNYGDESFKGAYIHPDIQAWLYPARQFSHTLAEMLMKASATRANEQANLSREESQLASRIANNWISVGKLAYPEQCVQYLQRMYAPFHVDYLEYHGIDLIRAVEWSRAIIDLLFDRLQKRLASVRYYEADCLRLLGSIFTNTANGNPLLDFLCSSEYVEQKRREVMSFTLLMDSLKRSSWINHEELVTSVEPADRKQFERFLDRVSMEIGAYNVGSPLDWHRLDAHPMLKLENSYFLPHPTVFANAIAKTFVYDLFEMEEKAHNMDDYDLHLVPSQVRGHLLENWVGDCFKRSFDEVQTGVEYDGPGGEADVVVRHGSTALLVEVKAKFLSQKARGGDIEKIKNDIEEGIVEATHQTQTRIEGIKNGEIELTQEKHGIKIDNEIIDRYVPIVIVGGEYGSLGTKEYTSLLDDDTLTPYVSDIYSFDIVTRILEKEGLVEYAQKRPQVSNLRQLDSPDELDFLGAFLDGTLDGYLNSERAKTVRKGADITGFDVIAPITDKDTKVREMLPEYERHFSVNWLAPSEKFT
jgi:Holliday junction resolvase-like predicted endonuclease